MWIRVLVHLFVSIWMCVSVIEVCDYTFCEFVCVFMSVFYVCIFVFCVCVCVCVCLCVRVFKFSPIKKIGWKFLKYVATNSWLVNYLVWSLYAEVSSRMLLFYFYFFIPCKFLRMCRCAYGFLWVCVYVRMCLRLDLLVDLKACKYLAYFFRHVKNRDLQFIR